MATHASSILARGETTENTWFDDIDTALTRYQRALARIMDTDDPHQVQMRYIIVNMHREELARHGVTVCGQIGRA